MKLLSALKRKTYHAFYLLWGYIFVFSKIFSFLGKGYIVALNTNITIGDASIMLGQTLLKAKTEGKTIFFVSLDIYKEALLAFYPSLTNFKVMWLSKRYEKRFLYLRFKMPKRLELNPNFFHCFFQMYGLAMSAYDYIQSKAKTNGKYLSISYEGKRLCEHPYIINRYSNSSAPLQEDEIEQLCHALKQKGYLLFENTKEAKSKIDGATPIWPSYPELISYISEASCFISLRSGVCDLAAQTHVKMISISIWWSNSFDRFGLECYGRGGIMELSVDDLGARLSEIIEFVG